MNLFKKHVELQDYIDKLNTKIKFRQLANFRDPHPSRQACNNIEIREAMDKMPALLQLRQRVLAQIEVLVGDAEFIEETLFFDISKINTLVCKDCGKLRVTTITLPKEDPVPEMCDCKKCGCPIHAKELENGKIQYSIPHLITLGCCNPNQVLAVVTDDAE